MHKNCKIHYRTRARRAARSRPQQPMCLSCYLTRFAGPHVVRFSAVEVYVSSWTGRCRMVTLAHKGSICTTQIHHAFVFSLYVFMSLCFFLSFVIICTTQINFKWWWNVPWRPVSNGVGSAWPHSPGAVAAWPTAIPCHRRAWPYSPGAVAAWPTAIMLVCNVGVWSCAWWVDQVYQESALI